MGNCICSKGKGGHVLGHNPQMNSNRNPNTQYGASGYSYASQPSVQPTSQTSQQMGRVLHYHPGDSSQESTGKSKRELCLEAADRRAAEQRHKGGVSDRTANRIFKDSKKDFSAPTTQHMNPRTYD